jgi:hypothetical protein
VGKKPRYKKFEAPGKSPIAVREPDTGKVPRAVSATSYHHLHPSWRVASIELVDPFGWHGMSGESLLAVREKLASFESMTWSEILVRGKKFHHSIRVSDITAEAQNRLEAAGLGLDEVVSLRLSNLERVFGYLVNGVLVLLWWDPSHQVCPSRA